MYTYDHMYFYLCIYTSIYIHIYIYIHVYAYIYVYICLCNLFLFRYLCSNFACFCLLSLFPLSFSLLFLFALSSLCRMLACHTNISMFMCQFLYFHCTRVHVSIFFEFFCLHCACVRISRSRNVSMSSSHMCVSLSSSYFHKVQIEASTTKLHIGKHTKNKLPPPHFLFRTQVEIEALTESLCFP